MQSLPQNEPLPCKKAEPRGSALDDTYQTCINRPLGRAFQSRSKSFKLVVERVLASTVLTIMAAYME